MKLKNVLRNVSRKQLMNKDIYKNNNNNINNLF